MVAVAGRATDCGTDCGSFEAMCPSTVFHASAENARAYLADCRLYERFRGEAKRLQKDPSPRVRAAALHAEQDACLIEQLEANLDRADEQGWRYSDAPARNSIPRRRGAVSRK
jgi:hypothetical protein